MKRCSILIIPIVLAVLSGCAWGTKHKTPETVAYDTDKAFQEGNEQLKKGRYVEARETFQKLQHEDVEKNYDIVARLRIADSFYEEGKYEEGITEYRQFINMHPTNKLASYAQYQIAMSYFKQMSTIDRNAHFMREAEKNFNLLIDNYPKSPYLDEAKERVRILTDKAAEYELYVARFYFKKESYKAAIGRLEGILAQAPQSSAAPETLFLLGQSYENLREKGKAREYYTELLEKFPKEGEKFKVQSRLAKLDARK